MEFGMDSKARAMQLCDVAETEGSVHNLLTALKACSKLKDSRMGEQLHAAVVKYGRLSNVYVANTLVDMHAKCGNLLEARNVFESMLQRNTIAWNCIIMGHAENGQGEEALKLYKRMQDEGCSPNRITIVAALKACASLAGCGLERGKDIHALAVEKGLGGDVYVTNTLVNMYGKCGSMVDAWKVFSDMTERGVVSWNCILGGYLQSGEYEVALQIYSRMQNDGHSPSSVTFLAALKACAALADREDSDRTWCLEKGKAIHNDAKVLGEDTDIYVANTLVDMYAKCGSMPDAREVFDGIKQPTVVSWTALIMGYSQCHQSELALNVYARMHDRGCKPNAFTYVAALRACANLGNNREGIEKGKRIHLQVIGNGLDKHDVFVTSSLVDMYSKCGSMADARLVFEGMPRRSSVSWSCIIMGYAQAGDGPEALEIFNQMLREECCVPDVVTFMAATKACTALAVKEEATVVEDKLVKVDSLGKGRVIHSKAERVLKTTDVFLAGTLVEMYAKCGSMSDSWSVFQSIKHPNIVLWNCIIQGYAENGQGEKALELFSCIPSKGISPDAITFMAAAQACSSLLDKKARPMELCLEACRSIHSLAVQYGYDSDRYVGNTLVDLYGKCGKLQDAQQTFKCISYHDIVSWNSYMTAHLLCGKSEAVLELYRHMQEAGLTPSASTYVAALKAYSNLGNLETGRQLHAEICNAGLDNDGSVSNSLLDLYGKCGSMDEAEQVFEATLHREVRTWNVLLSGYSRQGNIQRVLQIFERMRKLRIQPDEVTFLCILATCNHAGLVAEGRRYFEAMREEYGIFPGVEHYTCLVDLLGRANELDEAVTLVKNIPFEADKVLWMTLLDAAHKWNNSEVGKLAFEAVVRLDSTSRPYVMMSNIYENIQDS